MALSESRREPIPLNSLQSSLQSVRETPPESEPHDPEYLIRKNFENDPRQGLDLLFRRYYRPLCSHAVRFVYSRQVAEDLVAEVFFQFWRTQAYRSVRGTFLAYLFSAIRNEAFTYLRREFGRTDSLDSVPETRALLAPEAPDQSAQFNQLFLTIQQAIDELPTQCQRVFLLSRFENLKNQQIADELGISLKTVEFHVTKALAFLRNRLRLEGFISVCLSFFFVS